jgi:hypothetical protein
MIELISVLGVYIVDWMLEFAGIGGYLLVLLPPLIFFFRKLNTPSLLAVVLISGLLSEAMHGYYAGTLLAGMGVGLLIFQSSERTVDWRSPLVQILGLFFYGLIVFFTRGVLAFLGGGVLVFPSLLSLLVSFCCAWLILLLFRKRAATRRRY